MTCILLVERNSAYTQALQRRYTVTSASSGKQALHLINTSVCEAIVLDAISLKTPGDRIVRQIKAARMGLPVVHLRPADVDALNGDISADATLTPPFTARKIINQIERLLNHNAHNDEPLVDAPALSGVLLLDLDRRQVIAHGRETTLTPKVALLLSQFVQRPGETLSRKQLMEAVWDTDFMGDTRTLDVHIRMIRCAIELDPSKPHILKTVRGVGYRLELDPEALDLRAPALVASLA